MYILILVTASLNLEYEEAILNYNKIIKKPNHISAIFNKGLCFEKLEKYKIAIEYYDK